jgi:prepilin-type N-terminal cleavage/methylation domain-containing protein
MHRILHLTKEKLLKKAFSLVELLVVIAIIAGLVGLLLPNLRRLQEHAMLTKCQNNLKEIGKAVGQYLQDYEGYFIYPGPGGVGSPEDFNKEFSGDPTRYGLPGIADKIAGQSAGIGVYSSAARDDYFGIMARYVPYDEISMSNLSFGIAPIRVCPVVLQDIKRTGNFFDPSSPSFKGWRECTALDGSTFTMFDFQGTVANNVELNRAYFTTYGINPLIIYRHQKNINPNTVVFIDWNAKEGWSAYCGYTNWMFETATNAPIHHNQGDPKWTNAWWITEVGFYHPAEDNSRGAAYLAFDGHVGVISSNRISTNFMMLGK